MDTELAGKRVTFNLIFRLLVAFLAEKRDESSFYTSFTFLLGEKIP